MFSNSTFESRALRLFLADCVVGKVAKCDLNPEVNFTFITSIGLDELFSIVRFIIAILLFLL